MSHIRQSIVLVISVESILYLYDLSFSCLLYFLLHCGVKFLHYLIIQFLPELPCYRIGNILIYVLSSIVQPPCLVVRHGNKDIAFL